MLHVILYNLTTSSTNHFHFQSGRLRIAFSLVIMMVMLSMCPFAAHGSMRDTSSNREMLENLDKLIPEKSKYIAARRAKGDSLYNLARETPDIADRLPLLLEAADVWRGLSTDSVIIISNRGLKYSRQLQDTFYVQSFFLTRAHAFFYRGQSHDCMADFFHVAEMGVHPDVVDRFNYVGHVVFVTLGTFYNTNDRQWTDYSKRGRSLLKASMERLDPSSPEYAYYDGMVNMIDGNYTNMRANFEKVIANTTSDNIINPLAYTLLGYYYSGIGDLDNAVRYLSTAAAIQIQAANLHEVPLLLLGEVLYSEGDLSRASNYLAESLEDAIHGNMKFNLMRVNQTLIDVSRALDADRYKRYGIMVALVVLLMALLVVVVMMVRKKRLEVKKLRATEAKLARANLAKETYITEFMNLCSSYIESLEDYNKMAKRKITAGQTDDLLSFIKSGKIIDQQRDKFFDVFDDAFLQLFPDYVNQVNELLLPEKRITPSSPGVLTTELRILALSRLGIDDVQDIARFLGISANTIYTYRNKLRTRAIDRNTFEEDAKRIGAI